MAAVVAPRIAVGIAVDHCSLAGAGHGRSFDATVAEADYLAAVGVAASVDCHSSAVVVR